MGPGSVPCSVSMLTVSPAEGTHQQPPHSSQRALFFFFCEELIISVMYVVLVVWKVLEAEWGCSLQASHSNTNTRFQTLNTGNFSTATGCIPYHFSLCKVVLIGRGTWSQLDSYSTSAEGNSSDSRPVVAFSNTGKQQQNNLSGFTTIRISIKVLFFF